MIPTIGRIVVYKTTEDERKLLGLLHCNQSKELPAIIVAVWGNTPESVVNLKVMIDGKADDFWKTSICVGEIEGTWHWPVTK